MKGEALPVPLICETSLEWSSLAPGEYDIFAQQWDPRSFSPALKLATVTLATSGTRELRLELPPTKPILQTLPSVMVSPVAGFAPSTIEAFGRDAGGAPRPIPHASEEVSGGMLLYLDTSGVGRPFFGTTMDRFIVLPVNEDGQLAVASVFDLAGGSLQLRRASESVPLPSHGTVVFHGCPQTIAVPVAVGRGAKVTFLAPAGCSSLVLDFDPFSTIILRKRLPFGDPTWLGELMLHASGSATVRVATEEGARVANAIVSISALSLGSEEPVPLAETKTDAEGWARFNRLPVGPDLAVTARSAEGDHSAVEIIHADPIRPAMVDPLRLPKSASLIVEPKLAEKFVTQFPDGRIRSVFLEGLDGNVERRTQPVNGSDNLLFDRLLPGRWQLGVEFQHVVPSEATQRRIVAKRGVSAVSV